MLVFALNEYQSGVFQDGNIFNIEFLEFGDQIVKGILDYNIEEVLNLVDEMEY